MGSRAVGPRLQASFCADLAGCGLEDCGPEMGLPSYFPEPRLRCLLFWDSYMWKQHGWRHSGR